MRVHFTADPHFGQAFIAKLRGFPSIETHDFALAQGWHRVVRADDHVWVLGDLAGSGPTAALALLAQLPGHKHLIAGNHDSCHPMHRDAHRRQAAYLEVFESVQAFARRRIAGHDVMLSHFPYTSDRTDIPRFDQYRLRDEGRWLLHGHTHSSVIHTGPREIHVGVDAWELTPVPLSAVEEMIRSDVAW